MQIHKSVHANHCFECFDGGNLIICDACPAAYHEYCLKNQPNSDGAWFCPDCQQGKLIYYKDIVWAKVNNVKNDTKLFSIYFTGYYEESYT